jgi:mono/diheme cytochrome c family protein
MSGSTRVRMVAFALIALAFLGALIAFAATTGTTTTTAKAPATTGAATTTGASKGNAAAAKAIFTSKCIVCHKADGSGGVKLTGNPTPNWKDPKIWADPKRKTDDYFRDCITNGKTPSGMVAWGKTGQIKPADIENLIAYIHTLAPGKAPAKTAATAPAKTSSTK